MWQSVKVLNAFNTLTLKQIFWKRKTLWKRLEYHFLVESTNIENASFPYKTATSEANVKTNKMVTTKWSYRKERSFASALFFWKFYFSLRTFYTELICCTNNPNAHICTFCKRLIFIWRCFFPVSILNLIFLIKPFFLHEAVFPTWPRSHDKNLDILKTKKAFKMK